MCSQAQQGRRAAQAAFVLVSPDLPVFKHDAFSQQNLGPNEGLHCHAIVLMSPTARLKERFDLWLTANMDGVRRDTQISRIHIEQIEATPEYMTQYAFKSVGVTLAWDSVLILPREVGSKPNLTDRGYDEAVRTVQGASLMRTGRRSA